MDEYRALRTAELAAMAVEDLLVRPIYDEERRVAKEEKKLMAEVSFKLILLLLATLDDYYFYLYATTLTIDFYICYFWLLKNCQVFRENSSA